jgi:diguanylate cyclase
MNGLVGTAKEGRFGSLDSRSWHLLIFLAFVPAMVVSMILAKKFEIPGQASVWYPPAGVVFALFTSTARNRRFYAYVLAVVCRFGFGLLLYGETNSIGKQFLEALAIMCVFLAASYAVDHIDASRGDLVEFGRFILFGVVLTPTISGLISAIIEKAFGVNQSWMKIRTFVVGDAIGIITVVPLIAILYRSARGSLERKKTRAIPTAGSFELILQAVVIAIVPLWTFVLGVERGPGYWVLAVFPVLWIALRSDLRYAIAGVALANSVIAVAARQVLGTTDRLVDVQILLLAGAIAAGYVGTVVLTYNARAEGYSERERRISLVARLDQVTGAPNRYGLLELIGSTTPLPLATDRNNAISQFGPGKPLSIVVIDINHFADVIDGLGIAVGNTVLSSVAKRLQDVGGSGSVVARVEGDTFAVALPIGDVPSVVAKAERMLHAIQAEPYEAELGLYLTARAGVAVEVLSHDADETLRNASIALRSAKRDYNDEPVVFVEKQRAEAIENRSMLSSLRNTINQHQEQLHLVYQPIVSSATGRIVGAEALARWRHPELGLIPPSRFIALAERSGLMRDLGEVVMHQAVNQLGQWTPALDGRPFRLHVNVSPQQLADLHLPGRIATVCVRAGVRTERLMIELTETALGGDPQASIRMLTRLKDIGVYVALDDFGTGFSTIGWLSKFPIDELKIDQSFVAGIPDREDDVSIAKLILGLAQDLSLTVTAEGVENEQQRDVLSKLSCDHLQGYFFGHPVSAEAFTELLFAPAELLGP